MVIDLTNYLTYSWRMKIHNVAEAKAKFSAILEEVQEGETVIVCKRNKAIAKIVPIEEKKEKRNHTKIGWYKGEMKINCDLTEPCIPLEDWEMLK